MLFLRVYLTARRLKSLLVIFRTFVPANDVIDIGVGFFHYVRLETESSQVVEMTMLSTCSMVFSGGRAYSLINSSKFPKSPTSVASH